VSNSEALVQVKAIADRLKKQYHAEQVILFGSYATGAATKDSDVDLLVIAPTKERFFERMASVKRLIRDLRKGLPVAPIVLTPKEIADRKKLEDSFVTEILEKGLAF
jgi:predicted nucleotidyltransferase